jgi:hypothetical protein
VGLKLAGLLPDPALEFNTMLQRFDQRFACFLLLQRPEPLQFEAYVGGPGAAEPVPRCGGCNAHRYARSTPGSEPALSPCAWC